MLGRDERMEEVEEEEDGIYSLLFPLAYLPTGVRPPRPRPPAPACPPAG